MKTVAIFVVVLMVVLAGFAIVTAIAALITKLVMFGLIGLAVYFIWQVFRGP